MKKHGLFAITAAWTATSIASPASADYAGSILGNEAAIRESIIAS